MSFLSLQELTFEMEDAFQAWVEAEKTAGGIDVLLRRDDPSKLIDTGLPSFKAADPSTWVTKEAAKIRLNASLRYREFKCMCYGKSKAKSTIQKPETDPLQGARPGQPDEAVANETAQDRFLRLAKEDKNRGRRKARKGLEIKLSNKIDCKYRFTATIGAKANG
jgi:hypothetical protein